MAVTAGFSSESAVSTSEASFSWSLVAGANADAAIVFVISIQGTSDVSSVTYGGTAMAFLWRGSDTDTEAATIDAYFLDGIATGTQTIVVNRVNDATQMMGVAVSVESDTNADLEVPTANIVTTGGTSTNTGASTSGTGVAANAEVNVDDGSPGTNSLRFSAQYTGAASPPATGSNSTQLQNHDFTAFGWTTVRETTAGQGSRPVGSTSGSDDRAGVFLAVREVAGAVTVTPGTASLTTARFTPTVSTPRLVTPGVASLITVRFAPTVLTPRLITPGLATLTTTRFAPTVTVSGGGGVSVTPGTAALTLTRFAPTVLTPRTVIPGTASLITTRFAPTALTPSVVTPGAVSLTTTRFAPTVTASDHKLVTPGTASLIATGYTPDVTTSGQVGPSRLQMTVGTSGGEPVTYG